MEEWVWEICNKVWKGKGWPEGWKERVIVPIKKGRRERGKRLQRGDTNADFV